MSTRWNSYRIGKAVGLLASNTTAKTAVCLCISAGIAIYKYTPSSYSKPNTYKESIRKSAYEECIDIKESLILNHNKYAYSADFSSAINVVRHCLQVTSDDELRKLFISSTTSQINRLKLAKRPDAGSIASLYDDLITFDPSNKSSYEPARVKYSAIAKKERDTIERAERAAEKARKKKEGVSVGMTTQDVLDSAWGKPSYVNTRITSRGEHQQWVYPGNNYLHFQNGVLESIHTSRQN